MQNVLLQRSQARGRSERRTARLLFDEYEENSTWADYRTAALAYR